MNPLDFTQIVILKGEGKEHSITHMQMLLANLVLVKRSKTYRVLKNRRGNQKVIRHNQLQQLIELNT